MESLYIKCKKLLPKQLKNKLKIVFAVLQERIAMSLTYLSRPNLYNWRRKERIGIAYMAPSDMPIEDRLFLYSIVRTFRPYRALEIGVFRGGSALIITNAMEDNEVGSLVGIDPYPNIKYKKEAFHNRYKLLKSSSPEAIPEAVKLLGGQLDFVLLDSIHIFDQVYKEIKTILPYMSEDSIILIHDAFHYGVNAAIEKIIKEHKDVIDCGFINRTPYVTNCPWTPYRGLHMLKVNGKSSAYFKQVEWAYKTLNLPLPQFGEDILNHDNWYCKFKPCERCIANKMVIKDDGEFGFQNR